MVIEYINKFRFFRERINNFLLLSEFTDIDVMAQAMTFYGDGFETSSISLSFALYELAKNLDIQSKLQHEVDTVLAGHKGEITYEAVQEMSYLDKIISGIYILFKKNLLKKYVGMKLFRQIKKYARNVLIFVLLYKKIRFLF